MQLRGAPRTAQPPCARTRVVEGAQRKLAALLLLVVLAQLQQHQLAERSRPGRRVERAALGLAPRAGFLEERLVAEEPHALLHRQILGVQPDADDEAGEPHQRFGELPELERRDRRGRNPASTIMCSQ